MIERVHIQPHDHLNGFDTHQSTERPQSPIQPKSKIFQPNIAYDDYFKIHKVFVGESGGARLQSIGENLKDEWLPQYLNVAGWAYAESALTQTQLTSETRMLLMDNAVECWENSLRSQQEFDDDIHREWLSDHVDTLRMALNLAYAPMMQAIIAGDVTETTRERTFADTLAIAQLSTVKLALALKNGDMEAVGEHRGFQYECNALLSILHMNNPNYVPIPSSARAGSGYDYREQTHDISLIHQRWGRIHKVTPIEIKASASLNDRRRYKALIVRGKMHLSVVGRYSPSDTLNAFAAIYDGEPTSEDIRIADHASNTMKDLLVLYQKGKRVEEYENIHSHTKFHSTTRVAEKYKGLSTSPQTN